jgi:hypothetical protein
MADEFGDNAPDLRAGFEEAASANPEPEQQPEAVQRVATRSEFEERLARHEELRAKLLTPKLVSILTPEGTTRVEVDEKEFDTAKQEFEENQRRTEYLDRRLSQRNLTREFKRSR